MQKKVIGYQKYLPQPLYNWLIRFEMIPYLIKWLILSIAIGCLAGSSSAIFLTTLDWVTAYRNAHNWVIVLLPLAGWVVGMLYWHFGKTVALGNNLLIDTLHHPTQKPIPLLMAPMVYVATLITHLFGGSAGREGTALQMAGSLADQLHKPLGLNSYDRKMVLIAAIAAGFGSVFGTPLAGTVFALEVYCIGKINYQALFAALAAALIADWVTQHLWQVGHTRYLIGQVPAPDLALLGWCVLAGVVFGISAAAFSQGMHRATAFFQRYINYVPLRTVVGGILVAAAVWLLNDTQYIGLGIPTMVQAFQMPMPVVAFLLKMLFTIVTLASGFKGGEVTPLFFIGALLGNALSYGMPLPVGLLTGMGFVAVFAGAANTPIACIFMGIELFGADSGVYIAVACVVAYCCSGSRGIYSRQQIGEPKHPAWQAHANAAEKDTSSSQ